MEATREGYTLMVLLFGVIAFAGALSIYAVIVRSQLVPGSTRLLVSILFGGSLLEVLTLSFISPASTADVLLALVISWSLALAFTIANTAIEMDSPTQSLVIFL